MKNKFNIGDDVYTLYCNEVRRGKVYGVWQEKSGGIYYILDDRFKPTNTFWHMYEERKVFSSKEDLSKYIPEGEEIN